MTIRVWHAVAGALSIAGALSLVGPLASAPALAESSFSALSSATAVDTTVANGDLPVVTEVVAAGPSAGTSWSSTGQGTAFAANPYPGETVAGLPGVAAGLSGLPLPGYPLYVATTSDDEPADFSQPGIELHAACLSGSKPGCTATSSNGADPATSQARSSVTQASADEVTASAQADNSGFDVGGTVTVSDVHTSATVVLKDGKLTRRSELTVSRITAGESQAFSISDGTVRIAGSDVPVPFSTLVDALKDSGVEAQFFAAAPSKNGIVAPTLRLTTVLPGAPAGLAKPSRVVYTLGGAHAAVALGAFHPADRPSSGGSSSGPADAAVEPAGDSTSPSGTAPLLPDGLGDVQPGPAAATEPVPGGAQPGQPEPTIAQVAAASLPTQLFDVADIYLAIVLMAAVWFGATQAIRIFGVRFPWTS